MGLMYGVNNGNVIQRRGFTLASTTLNAIPSHANAHTKGAATAIGGTSGYGRTGVYITLFGSAANATYLVDLLNASDQVIVSNLIYRASTTCAVPATYFFPFNSGLVTKARCQSSGAGSTNLYVGIEEAEVWDEPAATYIATHGATTATTRGIEIDPGGVAHTLSGTKVEIAATTAAAVARGFVLGFGNNSNAAMATASWMITPYIGAAASEVEMCPDYGGTGFGFFTTSNSTINMVLPNNTMYYRTIIPPSSRISVDARCTSTDATDRLIDVIMYLVY